MKILNLSSVLLYLLFLLPPAMADNTTGYWQEMQEQPLVNKGKPRTGKEIYNYRCGSCHERSTQGAPLLDDSYEWQKRAGQGTQKLMEHVLNGTKNTLMPTKGGCENCSSIELYNALVYMLETSKIGFKPEAFKSLKLEETDK